MEYNDLTPAQKEAVDNWLEKEDPDGYRFECRDNFRYAVQGDEASLDLYETKRLSGCCGFVDEEFEVEGKTLYFGFNYGH